MRTLQIGLLATCLTGPALATSAQELDVAELRALAQSGKAVSLRAALESLSKAEQAVPLEARAFRDGHVYYKIVLKRGDGQLITVHVDAQSGEVTTFGDKLALDTTNGQVSP